MADNIEIEQRVLDGDLIGPVNAEIDTKDFTGLVALENSLLDGTGSEISIELSESLGVIGLDDLVEVKSEIDKSVLKAESTVTEAQRQIDKANATIADLNAISTQITTLVGEAKQAAATATNEAADAGRSETAAASSAKAASDSQKAAATSQAQALASQKAAATSQAQALASQKAAKTSETNASGHEARTLQSEKNAAASAKAADTDQKAALAAQKAAELARDAAKASENTASTHAGSAFSYKTDAETALASAKKSEAAAAQSAKEAETSASSMTQSVADARTARDAAISARDRSESARDISVSKASIATTKAAEASSSAADASSSASAAKTSETNALNSQRAAKTSETNSKTSETNSKASERVALASKDAAAKSATAASASAADAKKSQDAAKASRDEAEHFAEELRKGSVYRGIWNPNSNKYPDVPPTNSRWDVQLNKGQLEKIFDGKEWNWGDRLIYVLETKSFDIIDSGTGVTSVNGETGSITINRDTLGALGKTEKAADSAKLEGSTKAQIIAKAREGLASAGTSYNKAESDSKYLPKNTNIDLNVNDNAHIGVNAGTNKDATFYLTEDSGKHGAYIRYNGSAGNNRTYLGTRSSNAETAFAYVERGSKDLHVVGNVTLDTEQSSVGNSLTRRDWVQGELDKKANTTKATIGKVKMQLGTTIGGANVDNAPLIVEDRMGIDGNEIYSKIDMILGTLANYIDFKKGTQQLVRIGDAGLDVVTGTLKESGQRVYSPNNKPKIKDLSQPYETTKNLQLTAGQWTTLLTKADFKEGSGVYQILVQYHSTAKGGAAYVQNYTGQLYWHEDNTNQANLAEFPLHHMGHADGGEYIYLRTQTRQGNKGDQTVDIKCNKSYTSAVAFTVKLVRIM